MQLEDQDIFSEVADHTQCTCLGFYLKNGTLNNPHHRWCCLLLHPRRTYRTPKCSYTVLTTSQSSSTTFQSGQDTVVRGTFTSNGTLLNTQNTAFRAISDNWPVFGLARDLGTVSPKSATGPAVVFSIGHVRDPAIQYIVAGGQFQDRSSFFFTQYASATAAVRERYSKVHDEL